MCPSVVWSRRPRPGSFLGLIENGLGWSENPGFGGWGGRYALYQASGETRPIWTNNHDSRDTFTADNGKSECSDQATVWRWREAFQNDFAARTDWSVSPNPHGANHNPIAIINGDRTRKVVRIQARAGETVELTAAGSHDPDWNRLALRWFVYPEAGTYADTVTLSASVGERTSLVVPTPPADATAPQTIHLILEARADGSPALFAYRRAIIALAR